LAEYQTQKYPYSQFNSVGSSALMIMARKLISLHQKRDFIILKNIFTVYLTSKQLLFCTRSKLSLASVFSDTLNDHSIEENTFFFLPLRWKKNSCQLAGHVQKHETRRIFYYFYNGQYFSVLSIITIVITLCSWASKIVRNSELNTDLMVAYWFCNCCAH